MMRVTTDAVEMTTQGREATPEDMVDYASERGGDYYCGAVIDVPDRPVGRGFRWTCTRDGSRPHLLHIALSGREVFCASWYERVIIEEDPDFDELLP